MIKDPRIDRYEWPDTRVEEGKTMPFLCKVYFVLCEEYFFVCVCVCVIDLLFLSFFLFFLFFLSFFSFFSFFRPSFFFFLEHTVHHITLSRLYPSAFDFETTDTVLGTLDRPGREADSMYFRHHRNG